MVTNVGLVIDMDYMIKSLKIIATWSVPEMLITLAEVGGEIVFMI